MAENRDKETRPEKQQRAFEPDARDLKRRDDRERDDSEKDPSEGRDRPPSGRGRDPNSPWLGGG